MKPYFGIFIDIDIQILLLNYSDDILINLPIIKSKLKFNLYNNLKY